MNGYIHITGAQFNGSDWDMFLRKYDGQGNLDITFGSSGMVVYDKGSDKEPSTFGQDIYIGFNNDIFVVETNSMLKYKGI